MACLSFSNSAMAQVPSQQTIDRAKAKCAARSNATAKAYCLLLLDVRVGERKQAAGQKDLAEALAQQKLELERLRAELDKAKIAPPAPREPSPSLLRRGSGGGQALKGETRAQRIARLRDAMRARRGLAPVPVPKPAEPTKPTVVVQPLPPQMLPVGPPPIMPTQGQVVPIPANYATTADIDGVPRLGLGRLDFAVWQWLHSDADVRLIIRKNGVNLTVVSQGNVPYEQVWAKVAKGQPARYMVVNPAMFSTVYIPWVKPTDNIEIVVLTQTGDWYDAPGFGRQLLWVEAKKAVVPHVWHLESGLHPTMLDVPGYGM